MSRFHSLVACVLAAGLVMAGAAPAGAKPAARRRPAAPPKPPPGWVVDRVRFEPLDPAQGSVGVDGIGDYRGAIELRPNGAGLAVINDVGLDDYLRGISEVPSNWPAAALEAQAIAARSYALYELAQAVPTATTAAGAQICATDACQVYSGLAKERGPNGADWSAAVDRTAGQVLLDHGQPILAMYSSSNGGRSVAGSKPYLRAVDDPDDARSPLSHWRFTAAFNDLQAALGLPGPVNGLSRRGDTIDVTYINGDATQADQSMPVSDFRSKLNGALPAPDGMPYLLPSSRFDLAGGGDSVTFDGRGWGHGIGMSQYGALGKAQRGMKAADILAAYYAGIRPSPVPSTQLPADIRVALDLNRANAVVVGAARFRVLDGAGHPIATVASGRWSVVPAAGGKVRVVAPAGQDGVPVIANVSVDRTHVHLQLSAPAVVAASTPQGAILPPTAVDPGDLVLPVAVPLPDGDGQLTVTADAGGGRATTATAAYFVAAEPSPPSPEPDAHLARASASRSRAGFAHQSAAAGSVLVATRPSPLRQVLLWIALVALMTVVALLAAETRARRTVALR